MVNELRKAILVALALAAVLFTIESNREASSLPPVAPAIPILTVPRGVLPTAAVGLIEWARYGVDGVEGRLSEVGEPDVIKAHVAPGFLVAHSERSADRNAAVSSWRSPSRLRSLSNLEGYGEARRSATCAGSSSSPPVPGQPSAI